MFTPTDGPTQINRRNLTREIAVTANVYGAPPGTVGLEVQRRLQAIPLPPGYAFVTGGATKDMQESFGYALQALLLTKGILHASAKNDRDGRSPDAFHSRLRLHAAPDR